MQMSIFVIMVTLSCNKHYEKFIAKSLSTRFQSRQLDDGFCIFRNWRCGLAG